MGDDIEKTLKARAQHFEFFALALDETTDITNTAQLAIFIREVTSDFKIHEDLFSLEPMHGTTRGEHLFEKLLLAMRTSNLPFKVSTWPQHWAHRLSMVRLALRTLHREVFDASSAMTLYGMNLWLPNEFYPTANEWQNDPQAALQRHQQRVASYQYVLTRFPAQQKGNLNKRLLTCSHVMMSNEHKKHSLDALGLVLGISYAVAPKLASLMGKATPTQSASIAYSPLICCQSLTCLVMMFPALHALTTTQDFCRSTVPCFPLFFSSERCNSSPISVDVIAVPTTSYSHPCCAQTGPLHPANSDCLVLYILF